MTCSIRMLRVSELGYHLFPWCPKKRRGCLSWDDNHQQGHPSRYIYFRIQGIDASWVKRLSLQRLPCAWGNSAKTWSSSHIIGGSTTHQARKEDPWRPFRSIIPLSRCSERTRIQKITARRIHSRQEFLFKRGRCCGTRCLPRKTWFQSGWLVSVIRTSGDKNFAKWVSNSQIEYFSPEVAPEKEILSAFYERRVFLPEYEEAFADLVRYPELCWEGRTLAWHRDHVRNRFITWAVNCYKGSNTTS